MSPQTKRENLPATVAEPLVRAVPATARRIFHVGCGNGAVGAALKTQDSQRQVFGLESHAGAAQQARQHLDHVFHTDASAVDLALEPGSFDCLLYGDILSHLADPRAVLRRQRHLLRPGGCVLCYVPNAQHHTLFSALCTGDFPFAPGQPPEWEPRQFFTRASLFKLLLDCGYMPTLLEIVTRPCPAAWWDAAQPLLRHLHLDPDRAHRLFDTYRHLFRGDLVVHKPEDRAPFHDLDHRTEPPLSFVCCVSDEGTLAGNLLASPCFRPGSPHELLLQRGCSSAAAGLNAGLEKAKHEWIVCVHQDVYLPAGWPTRFWQQARLAAQTHGPLGVCGVMGASHAGEGRHWQAHLIHQDRPLYAGPLPAVTETLDELLLAFPRGTTLRLDPTLGFHFYGSDVCLAARRLGLTSVALDAPCFHNTRSNAFPPEFEVSAAAFARKWADQLPVVTPCVVLGRDGKVSYR
jgi:SAM-dependent methyltransferase